MEKRRGAEEEEEKVKVKETESTITRKACAPRGCRKRTLKGPSFATASRSSAISSLPRVISLRRPTAFAHAAVPCNPRLLRAPLPLPLHDVLLVIPAATGTVEHDHWFTGFTQARYTQLPPLTLQADRNKTSVRWRSVASAGEARNHPVCHRALRPRRPPVIVHRARARAIRFVGAFSRDSSLAFLFINPFSPDVYARSFPVSPRST